MRNNGRNTLTNKESYRLTRAIDDLRPWIEANNPSYQEIAHRVGNAAGKPVTKYNVEKIMDDLEIARPKIGVPTQGASSTDARLAAIEAKLDRLCEALG